MILLAFSEIKSNVSTKAFLLAILILFSLAPFQTACHLFPNLLNKSSDSAFVPAPHLKAALTTGGGGGGVDVCNSFRPLKVHKNNRYKNSLVRKEYGGSSLSPQGILGWFSMEYLQIVSRSPEKIQQRGWEQIL